MAAPQKLVSLAISPATNSDSPHRENAAYSRMNMLQDLWPGALASGQPLLPFEQVSKPKLIVPGFSPYYCTDLGDAYLADSREILKAIPDASVNAVVTSPPYALHFKKEYGNAAKHDYVEWFLPFAAEVFRVLTDDGSFVLNIGGSYNKGVPTRSLYHFKLLIALVEQVGFHLAQECFWFNPAKMPMPAE